MHIYFYATKIIQKISYLILFKVWISNRNSSNSEDFQNNLNDTDVCVYVCVCPKNLQKSIAIVVNRSIEKLSIDFESMCLLFFWCYSKIDDSNKDFIFWLCSKSFKKKLMEEMLKKKKIAIIQPIIMLLISFSEMLFRFESVHIREEFVMIFCSLHRIEFFCFSTVECSLRCVFVSFGSLMHVHSVSLSVCEYYVCRRHHRNFMTTVDGTNVL